MLVEVTPSWMYSFALMMFFVLHSMTTCARFWNLHGESVQDFFGGPWEDWRWVDLGKEAHAFEWKWIGLNSFGGFFSERIPKCSPPTKCPLDILSLFVSNCVCLWLAFSPPFPALPPGYIWWGSLVQSLPLVHSPRLWLLVDWPGCLDALGMLESHVSAFLRVPWHQRFMPCVGSFTLSTKVIWLIDMRVSLHWWVLCGDPVSPIGCR